MRDHSRMPVARVAFHGSLLFFRPRGEVGPVDHIFERAGSVKDAIESLGVPHPEVDLIVSDGCPVDPGSLVRLNDRLDVFGLDRPPELAGLPGLIPPPPDPPCFVVDGHLGRLARYLRMLDFDTWYERHPPDDLLARVSAEEGRILLTRDRGLLKRSVVRLGYLPRNDDPDEQLREVAARYRLAGSARPFSRCVRCNGVLRAVDRSAVAERLADQPRTLRYFDSFSECPDCGSIYWPGSHYVRISATLETLVGIDAPNARESAPQAQEGRR